MLKHLTRIILATLAGAWIVGCADYDTDINKINERLDGIEDNRIKTIDQQIEKINASLPELEKADKMMKDLIEALQGKAGELAKDTEKNAGRIDEANALIAELQKKDSELEKKIVELKTYIDGGIKDAKDWASATFATLEQYNGIVEQIAGLDKNLDGALERITGIDKRLDGIDGRLDGLDGSVTELDKKLDKAIEEVKTSVSELEKSLKEWVNERLTAYWTIEETKAALESQRGSLERRMNAQKDSLSKMIADNTGEIESLKAGLEKAEKAIKDNEESISGLRSDLEKAKTDIKAAYEKVIKDAVSESEGTMSKKIAAEVKTVNDRIDSVVKDVNDKLTALGERVSKLETDLNTLKDRFERRIQSLTHVPTYSNGVEKYEVLVIGGELKKWGDLTLRFEVKPNSAAGSITKEQVSANAVNTITRASAGDIRNLDIKSLSADAETGVLTVVIDPIDLYKASVENGLSSSVKIAVTDPSGLYDIASEYVNVERALDPGVLSYKTNDNQKIDFHWLKVYDPDGNESELIHEFADGIWTIYSLDEAAVLDIDFNLGLDFESKTLTDIHVNKPVSLCSDASDCFASCDQLTTAGFGLVDTRKVTNMWGMFGNCKSLESLDLTGWDTKNVTNMCGMFEDCKSLESLDIAGWDTKNVTNMAGMFHGCGSLSSLDLSGWDTKNVTDMERMFQDCRSLKSLDLSGWNTSSVKYMNLMFSGCGNLKSLDLSGWDTKNVTDMGHLFQGCGSLESLDLSGWNTKNVTYMLYMFSECRSLESLDLSGWDMRSVKDMGGMFKDCVNVKTITMKGCDDDTVRKIEKALTDAGIRGNVTIIRV